MEEEVSGTMGVSAITESDDVGVLLCPKLSVSFCNSLYCDCFLPGSTPFSLFIAERCELIRYAAKLNITDAETKAITVKSTGSLSVTEIERYVYIPAVTLDIHSNKVAIEYFKAVALLMPTEVLTKMGVSIFCSVGS